MPEETSRIFTRWKVALALEATPAKPSSARLSAIRNELFRRRTMISLVLSYAWAADRDLPLTAARCFFLCFLHFFFLAE